MGATTYRKEWMPPPKDFFLLSASGAIYLILLKIGKDFKHNNPE